MGFDSQTQTYVLHPHRILVQHIPHLVRLRQHLHVRFDNDIQLQHVELLFRHELFFFVCVGVRKVLER